MRKIHGAVKSALEWCWSALLRSVSPAVRAAAVSPVRSPEVRLGTSSRFKLASVVSSPPVELTNEVGQLLELRRAAFADGELFLPLDHIGQTGAVILAHITERGFIDAEHFLAVYPAPDPRCRLYMDQMY